MAQSGKVAVMTASSKGIGFCLAEALLLQVPGRTMPSREELRPTGRPGGTVR